MTALVPVLLAGGSGTRLWPTSRKSYPKQFTDLTGSGDSLLQASLKRSGVMPDPAPWIIVTGEDYRFLVAQQAREIYAKTDSIILEPAPRNTAPAIALAAFQALENHETAKLLIQTADHYIYNLQEFGNAVIEGLAASSPFVLFGIKPNRPETGYGYIECGTPIDSGYLVSSFKEKPDLVTAKSYVDSDNYLWNSGMFLLDATAYLQVLRELEPLIFTACQTAFDKAISDQDFKRVDSEAFSGSPSASIDYAIMERLDNLHAIPYQGDWSDVGAWNSVASLAPQDKNGNAIQGDGLLLDSQNTFVRAESRFVAGIGLDNLIIIETRDATLILNASKAQKVKELVDTLKTKNRKEAVEHPKIYRPWGHFETLVIGGRFQVKQIVVKSGGSLSLQMHHHRAEHWVVVTGTAEVQIDNITRTLTEDQSVYIPIGCKHRLRNPTKLPLTLIEVQSGTYLSEDDIVRFDDIYGRL